MSRTDTRPLLPPFPEGWYVVGFSAELPRGAVQPGRFVGQDVVLYRTDSGVANLMGAYCPHLGAHMGHGGTVRNECLVCPFHSFAFDTDGRCVDTPYGTRIPPKANAIVFPTQEKHGLILAYHGADDTPPAWEVPALNTDGWTPLIRHTWEMRGHPQETTENSVDVGHFTEIHGYSDVREVKPLHLDGSYLNVAYGMSRGSGLPGQIVRSEFEIHIHGLGHSQVDITVPDLGVRGRLFVLPTPTDPQQLTLRIAASVHESTRPGSIHPALRFLPGRLYRAAIAQFVFRGFKHDVSQDFVIWHHKRYVQPPILAAGDGPVGPYRQWAKQFYAAHDRALV